MRWGNWFRSRPPAAWCNTPTTHWAAAPTARRGGETTVTVYDGLRPIEAYDAGGAWPHTLTYGPGLDEPLGFWNSAGHYNYHLDGQGSVVALTNSSGHVVETYAYGPFGETAGASALGNPLRYTGRAYDAATGLYDNRLRNYHPVLGFFPKPFALQSHGPCLGNDAPRT